MTQRILPADSELVRMRDSGMTHQQIADAISERDGVRIARSTVSVALHRAGEQKDKRLRYRREVPWTVPAQFSTEYPLRMLRALGRKRSGQVMTADDDASLAAWLRELQVRDFIVAFCPEPPPGREGFYYIPASARDHKDTDTPIRIKPVTASQIGF